jgi:hypothetical protein
MVPHSACLFCIVPCLPTTRRPELSQMYLKSFEEGVAMARRDLMKSPSARPILLSGGHVTQLHDDGCRRWVQL